MVKSPESVRGIDAWRRFVDIPNSARHSCLFSVLISVALPSPHQSTRSLCFYRPSLPPHRSSLSSRVESRTCSTRVARFSNVITVYLVFPLFLFAFILHQCGNPSTTVEPKKTFLQNFKLFFFLFFPAVKSRSFMAQFQGTHCWGKNN